jgi:uncharacterized OB-fold protein
MFNTWEPRSGYIRNAGVDCATAVSWRAHDMIHTWRRLLSWGDNRTVHCECRRCGTTVDVATDECPRCGSTRLVRYEIP